MAKPKPPYPLRVIAFAADDQLREMLKTAARQECRTVSGEIVYRLRSSFELEKGDHDAHASA
jgi:hypothetical protein